MLVLALPVTSTCLMDCIFLAGPTRNAKATFLGAKMWSGSKSSSFRLLLLSSVLPHTVGHMTDCVNCIDLGSADPSCSSMMQMGLLFDSHWFISFFLRPQWTKLFKPPQAVSICPRLHSPFPGPQQLVDGGSLPSVASTLILVAECVSNCFW